MNYTLTLSLEHTALVKIATVLWNQDDIRALVKKFYFQSSIFSERQREWQVVEDKFAFEYAAVGGNKAATEYFLQKLTSREREESLVRSTGYVAKRRCVSARNRTDHPKEHYADVLCFLLSQKDEEQQTEVFKNYPYKVLKCFLDRPWQNFFMQTANRMWDCLSGEDCNLFLREMANKVKEGHKDYDYQMLFEEFWQQSPDAHKRYVIDECASGFLLSKLFEIKDEKNIKLILKDATLIEKKKLIFCDRGQDICQDLIYGDKWDLLKFFIRECISSRNKMIKFKEEFKERITWCCSKEELARNKDKLNKFLQLLDDFICGYDKRKCVEEGNSSPAKRLRRT
ncbi:hypothetical protein JTE90_008779 [Oedothorax gibbosus]|uniref:Uncharacterized protein n=1 Tax=Oedothorax gibbosus TaxID=931172 RepID=A0AAV6V4W3_9ARAC|nr:hypothetical protein JTE90_008779 [Oedothorax gibbosus]